MTLNTLAWLFTGRVLLHNLEEALWLPTWSMRAMRWYRPVRVPAPVFRFAAGALSLAFVVLTLSATMSQPGGVAAYLMAGYALAMLLNVLMPHALATVALRRYMPGTATALLLNLPLGLLYLQQALAEHAIEPRMFRWAGPLVVVGLLVAMPVLFALGRVACRARAVPQDMR
ncbi:HXXEE domain-containing protein [Rhodanobacter sp. Si-c]|uniref:HXXEE domain-containing protein n=1 Tax=Rhodanobacter lycopersici TaxID=3162487 RepID=A0ABV3QIR7_9GAMM